MSIDNLYLDLVEATGRFRSKVARLPYKEPTLYIDPTIVSLKYKIFKTLFPGISVYYAVKANPSLAVLATLAKDPSCGFDVASQGEIELLKSLQVEPHRIVYSNPVKPVSHIRAALDYGIKYFAIDSMSEYLKMRRIDPQSRLLLRIAVPNEGAQWPLGGKFGAKEEIDSIVQSAGAVFDDDLCGVSFHVGSQCITAASWQTGMLLAGEVLKKLRDEGIRPNIVNIGGGFPVEYQDADVSIKQLQSISKAINKAEIEISSPSALHLMAEPGRFLVAEAGIVKCQVIGTAVRQKEHWVHLDTGLFGGLIEPSQNINYKIINPHDTSSYLNVCNEYHIAGPTCDSVDVISKNHWPFPNVQEGETLMFANSGAYTSAYSSNFNGFSPMKVEVIS